MTSTEHHGADGGQTDRQRQTDVGYPGLEDAGLGPAMSSALRRGAVRGGRRAGAGGPGHAELGREAARAAAEGPA